MFRSHFKTHLTLDGCVVPFFERDLISERTKLGLIAARARGAKLGRSKGSLSKSKLDDRKEEIQKFLSFGVSKSAIARMMGVSRGTLLSFIGSRKIKG